MDVVDGYGLVSLAAFTGAGAAAAALRCREVAVRFVENSLLATQGVVAGRHNCPVKWGSSAKVGSIAVAQARLAFERELGWVFREQPHADVGIDAQVEVVDGENAAGRLLALQIKGGESWFRERCRGGWWYRPTPGHVEYWRSYSVPVVLILYHPVTERCHWRIFNVRELEATPRGGSRLLVPEANVLDRTALEPLRTAAILADASADEASRPTSHSRRRLGRAAALVAPVGRYRRVAAVSVMLGTVVMLVGIASVLVWDPRDRDPTTSPSSTSSTTSNPVTATAEAPTTPTSSGDGIGAALVGRWEGTYECDMGPTDLVLIIDRIEGQEVYAEYVYEPRLAATEGGSFRMEGNWDASGMRLQATDWIDEPAGGQIPANITASWVSPPTNDLVVTIRSSVNDAACARESLTRQ